MQLHKSLDHPYIIKFIDALQENNLVYFMLEYAGNGSLFFYINAREGVPENLALRFIYQAALGLQHMHQKNIIHRDVKPENILLDDGFNVKLCDFGWSCQNNDDEYRKSICGTYEYMSPEIVYDSKHNNKVDVWCLGILLYELLHGSPPYKVQSLDDLRRDIKSKGLVFRQSISALTKDLLSNLLILDEKNRPTIDQVLSHPCITSNIRMFKEPISESDFGLLIKNYMFNTRNNNKTHLPNSVLEASNKQHNGSNNQEMFKTLPSNNLKIDHVNRTPNIDMNINNGFVSQHIPLKVNQEPFYTYNTTNNTLMTNTNHLNTKSITKVDDKFSKNDNILQFKFTNNTQNSGDSSPVSFSLPSSLNTTIRSDMKLSTPNSQSNNANIQSFNPLSTVIGIGTPNSNTGTHRSEYKTTNQQYQPVNTSSHIIREINSGKHKTIYTTNNPSLQYYNNNGRDNFPNHSQSFHLIEGSETSFNRKLNPLNIKIERTNEGFARKNINTHKLLVPTTEFKNNIISMSFSEYNQKTNGYNFDASRLGTNQSVQIGSRPTSSQLYEYKYFSQNGQLVKQALTADEKIRYSGYQDNNHTNRGIDVNGNRNQVPVNIEINFKKNQAKELRPVYIETPYKGQTVNFSTYGQNQVTQNPFYVQRISNPSIHLTNTLVEHRSPLLAKIQQMPNPPPVLVNLTINNITNNHVVPPSNHTRVTTRQANLTSNMITQPIPYNTLSPFGQTSNNYAPTITYRPGSSQSFNGYRTNGVSNKSFEILTPMKSEVQRISITDRNRYVRY